MEIICSKMDLVLIQNYTDMFSVSFFLNRKLKSEVLQMRNILNGPTFTNYPIDPRPP